jgi:tetratricopeptide (TPR) repeat protein
MPAPSYYRVFLLGLLGSFFSLIPARALESDQIQIAPPMRQIQSPSPDASAEQLEKQGDELRSHKAYLDAIDYYREAMKKSPQSASLSNKVGISELMLQRPKEAARDFEHAIKKDSKFADAYNNLGVSNYVRRKYGAAIKQYKKALQLDADSASFHSNIGAAYFARKDFDHASQAYAEAVRLDPEIFEHTSHSGISAQIASPEDRAHYDFIVAKLYARAKDLDRSLQFLRKAMEEGYKGVKDVYTDPEFAELRKDARFAELMKTAPPPVPE